ncbi:MAG: TolC family protein [Synergistaceae bacterium]|nr:TolC family protein [Synergistaceae bacterium]
MLITKRKLIYILPIIISCVIIAPNTSSASVSMTLNQYISEILLNNHSLKAAIKSVEADYYSVLASVAYQRPSTNITANGSYVTAQSSGAAKEYNVFAGNAKFALTQRIDISGSYRLDEKQNILGYEVSRANFDNNLNNLIASAEELWWSTVLARENMKLQREIMLQRAENHRVTMEKYNQELVPRLDIVRSEAQVVEAQSLSKNAETAYMNLLAELSLMAGGLDVEPVDEELRVPEFDVSMNYEEALEFRPDVRAARLNLERAKLVKKLTAKGLSPTLDFAFQFTGWSDPEAFATPNDRQAGASLTLTIPLSDGNGTKYRTLNADRLIQAAESNLDALQEQTRRDITVAINNWRNASASEQDKQRQVERSEEELRITELMYSEGMGAQIDLINAQTAYQAVRTEYLDAVKNMYVALVALRKAIGDYSPNEDGSWREARQLYGKGNDIIGEPGFKTLRTDAKKGSTRSHSESRTESANSSSDSPSEAYMQLTEEELDARLNERLKTYDAIKTEREMSK